MGRRIGWGEARGSNNSLKPAWTQFPPDSPPSAHPAAPVVFHKLDAPRRGVRRVGQGDGARRGEARRGGERRGKERGVQ